jgi:hypothetical protein
MRLNCGFAVANLRLENRTQRYMFRMTDCAVIVNELDEVDWFTGKRMNYCNDLFYEMVWSCIERHVPVSENCHISKMRRRKLERD